MNLGLYGYLAAGLAYLFFTVLLLISWRASLQGKLLTVVIGVSVLWSASAAQVAVKGTEQVILYQIFEVTRYLAWYVFLLKLFDVNTHHGQSYRKFVSWALPLSAGFAALLLLSEVLLLPDMSVYVITGHVIMSLIGLAIIEQLLRNTSTRHRWAIKYLFIGAGIIFAFDFYLYSDALLFRGIDQEIWEVRSIINLVVVPLLAISAVRNKSWSLNIFVSRDIVLNTTAIIGGGLYLLLMASAGYYLREYGGSWARVGQALFFSMAGIFLVAVLSSGQLRARIKVFLGKHFYKNKYDYRIEWLKLTEDLSTNAPLKERYKAVVESVASIVDARAGQIWLRDEQGGYKNIASWHAGLIDERELANGKLACYFNDKRFIINVNEFDIHPDEYENLVLPKWLMEVQHPWLILPLYGLESLIGFIVLSNPLVSRTINWEDRDLLITAAKQVSSYLTVLMTSDALAEAKQFEVFTRLSAYMVHDLKNIASELELVAQNSKKHKSNPEFVTDAFETVEHAANDIKKLLEHLRNKRSFAEKEILIDLVPLINEVIDRKQIHFPLPGFESSSVPCYVTADKNRLANVLAHLIDNAQQATDDNGSIQVELRSNAGMHIVEINDTGHGMDEDFIQQRLFKPFDTTKGNAGMGIGMHESRAFIRELGGDIQVKSEPGKGTIISLHVPSSMEAEEINTNEKHADD